MKALFQRIGSQQLIAVAMFAAWLMQGIWISPVSPQAAHVFGRAMQNYVDENKETVEELNRKGLANIDRHDLETRVASELRHVWIFWLTLVILGFGAAVMTFFNIRFWQVTVAVTSLFYLWAWYNTGITAYVGVVQAYQAKIMLAENQGTMGWFLVRDVLLPILFASTIVYISASYITKVARSLG